MGKENDLKANLCQSLICYVRENHAEKIDKAYEYFWDNNYPEEFLGGTALELGFLNFEEWLIFDYKANTEKETFIDLYVKDNNGLKDDEVKLLNKIKYSVLSLYEVSSVSKDKRISLKDLLLGGEFSVSQKTLSKGLKKDDIFAARFLNLDNKQIMSQCVYPYTSGHKKNILGYIDNQMKRYKRNENPDGTMKDFLKDYGDTFNIIWTNLILNHTLKKPAVNHP